MVDFPNFIGRAILRQGLLAEKVCFSPSSGAFFTGPALKVLSVELISPNKEKNTGSDLNSFKYEWDWSHWSNWSKKAPCI